MKVEIRIVKELDSHAQGDKLGRLIDAIQRFAPSGSIVSMRVDGTMTRRLKRKGNDWLDRPVYAPKRGNK